MANAEQNKRHVIILGAGSSVTSGYPVANGLRLLMSSEKRVREELERLGKFNTEYTDKVIAQMMGGAMKETIDLFRHGGFATVDEFSNLAYNRLPKEVQNLKRLLRFALALHDPEENFEKSDYYVFIQKLFQKGLFPLRRDVAILTFNYEPYLPYLLSKAYSIRCQVSGENEAVNAADALTSGLTSRAVGALEHGDDLCVLQLHGTIAWPRKVEGEHLCSYGDLFGTSIKDRIEQLCFSPCADTLPPVLFPWEVFDQNGFVNEETFCLKEQPDSRGLRQGAYPGNVNLHQLFLSIWKRAHREITNATKISFVGLSMHDFLNPALRFLFANRRENAAIVCATMDHIQFRSADDVEAHINPRSPTFKVRRLLREVCPAVTGVPNRGDKQIWLDQGATVRVRETFRDFIENELD